MKIDREYLRCVKTATKPEQRLEWLAAAHEYVRGGGDFNNWIFSDFLTWVDHHLKTKNRLREGR